MIQFAEMGAYKPTAKPSAYYSRLKMRLIFAAFAFAAGAVGFFRLEHLWRIWFPRIPNIPSVALIVCLCGAIVAAISFLSYGKILRNVEQYLLTITPAGVLVHRPPLIDLFLSRDEITGFEEKKNGLVLRTANLMRNIPIHRDLERFAECRSELIEMGIHSLPSTAVRTATIVFAPAIAAIVGLALLKTANRAEEALGIGLMLSSIAWLAITYKWWIATYGDTPSQRWAYLIALASMLLGSYLSIAWHARRAASYADLLAVVIFTTLSLLSFYRRRTQKER